MGQLEDFRESLKKKKDITENTLNDHTKPKSTNTQQQMSRASIGISGELHFELKGLCIWMKKNGIGNNPSFSDMLKEVLKTYYKKYPEAKKFVEEFCE